jgi:hypothetical protein
MHSGEADGSGRHPRKTRCVLASGGTLTAGPGRYVARTRYAFFGDSRSSSLTSSATARRPRISPYSRMLTPSRHAACAADQPARFRSCSSIWRNIATAPAIVQNIAVETVRRRDVGSAQRFRIQARHVSQTPARSDLSSSLAIWFPLALSARNTEKVRTR